MSLVTLATAAGVSFIGFFIAVPLILALAQFFGVYAVIQERECRVYVQFGKVIAVLSEPGLHFLWPKLGILAPFFRFIGTYHRVDMRLDQEYLRSNPVNSEEGAPMGIGVWYEMYISDPVDFLFKNADPRGSLRANVSNASVRCLSNLKLADMLENRHAMSRVVRDEVTEQSQQWGYHLGSVYIRKVHFRDQTMIRQIHEKVVNRLRQVTAAILQDGANRVSVIASNAERKAAVEFARAAAMRPQIVGGALARIASNPEVAAAIFEILEVQKLGANEKLELVLVPAGERGELVKDLVAAEGAESPARGA